MPKKKRSGKKKGGCLSFIFGLIAFLLLLGVAATLVVIFLPQDLTNLKRDLREENSVKLRPSRDLTEVLRKSIEGNYPVTLSESDVNLWLREQLKGKQGGSLGDYVQIKNVWVRFNDGYAEVVIEREIAGFTQTVSLFAQVERIETASGMFTQINLHGNEYDPNFPNIKRGGRFGRLVVPQGFLVLILADFRKISEALDEEIELGFQRMADIQIEDGQLVLRPTLEDKDFGSF